MPESASIMLFRELAAEQSADYQSVSEVQVIVDVQNLLGLSKTNEGISASLQTIDKGYLLDTYLSELALLEITEPSNNDPIIEILLSDTKGVFKAFLEEATLMQLAFQRLERKSNKQLLQEIEENIEAEELYHAFNRIQRKENKAILQNLEESSVQENQVATNRPNTLRMALRIAAILLILAIPAGILKIYFTGDSKSDPTNTANNDPKKSGTSTDYFASAYVDIDLPKETQSSTSAKAVSTSSAMGYANAEVNFKIAVVNLGEQNHYLLNKKDKIIGIKSELSKKDFKSKSSTLDSLNRALERIELLTQQINNKVMTYTLVEKNLKIYTLTQKDLHELKVFNYNNNGEDRFYLYLDGTYYSLSEKQGKLKAETDETIISTLDDKQ
jgi:hypothetical protein